MNQYSHSKLSCFENCPKQYLYRYVLREKTGPWTSVEAFMGKRVHAILERLYHHILLHGEPPDLKTVQYKLKNEWDTQWGDHVEIIKDNMHARDYHDVAQRCVKGYYKRNAPFNADTTLALEKRISVQFEDFRLIGIIDRLSERDGTLVITDYKTSGRLPRKDSEHSDRQLAIYQLGIENTPQPSDSVELRWEYLQQGVTLWSHRSTKELDAVEASIVHDVARIEAEETFRANPGPLCKWCSFKGICPDARR